MSLLLKFRYRFESAHRFTSSAAPACRTPHGHTWHATAIFKMNASSLDASAMAAEFGAVKSAWKKFVTETVDHSFLHNVSDTLIPHLLESTPDARLLPFPSDPTTELIAGLFALKLQAMHQASNNTTVSPTGVLIQETPTNSVHFRFDKDGKAPSWLKTYMTSEQSWWMSSDPSSRELGGRPAVRSK